MVEQNNEVDRAISVVTSEILKLSPLDDESKAALSVTLEAAIGRLAIAIAAQSNQSLEASLEACAETVPT